jgi:phosphoglycolate phosphatase-like HAD superfamily hydrolase
MLKYDRRKTNFGWSEKMDLIPQWDIEIINANAWRGAFKSALFDFDGTISLIREGWQQVMKPYFCEVLEQTPRREPREAIERRVHDFVDFLTGKQTIYQCIQLAEEVEKRGGAPLDPQAYKDEYHSRLMTRIKHRIDALADGRADPLDHAVPGGLDILPALRARGVDVYLASGTDENYVVNECRLLGADRFCNGGVYGARQDYKLFSKKMIVEKILRDNDLHGRELVGFGDGYVEIENVKEAGGFAVGVATDEVNRRGIDGWKRNRLIQAGADIIIPDFSQTGRLINYLFDIDG